MLDLVPQSWRPALEPVLNGPAAVALESWLNGEEMAGRAVYPPRAHRWRALQLTPLNEVKVVILGQDPYHREGQAMGLAFSVPKGIRPPPSLMNVFKELATDCGIFAPADGDLSAWARQGVLLLNTCLSVEAGKAGSHRKRGWEAITRACLAAVATRPDPSVFILWGDPARNHAASTPAIANGCHAVIASPHPSPLSAYRGFFGSRPFSRANAFLKAHGRTPIDWRL